MIQLTLIRVMGGEDEGREEGWRSDEGCEGGGEVGKGTENDEERLH